MGQLGVGPQRGQPPVSPPGRPLFQREGRGRRTEWGESAAKGTRGGVPLKSAGFHQAHTRRERGFPCSSGVSLLPPVSGKASCRREDEKSPPLRCGKGRALGSERTGEVCGSRGIGVGKNRPPVRLSRAEKGTLFPAWVRASGGLYLHAAATLSSAWGTCLFSSARWRCRDSRPAGGRKEASPSQPVPGGRREASEANAPFIQRRRPCHFLPLRAMLF